MCEKINTIEQLIQSKVSTLYTITTDYNSDTVSIVNFNNPVIIKKGKRSDTIKDWLYVILGIGFNKKLNIKLSIVNEVNPEIMKKINLNNLPQLINMLIINEKAPITLFTNESDAIASLNSMKYNIKQKIITDPILQPPHKKLYFDKQPIVDDISRSLYVSKFENVNPVIESLINLYKECIIE